MRLSNVILTFLSLSSTTFAFAAPRSSSLDGGLKVLEKACQCSAVGSVCHKVSHINCCNGLSCEMMDNVNGDYGICRASNNDHDKDEQCMCSKSGGECHPQSDMNCCFGLFCDMANASNGDHGKCRPSKELKNPLKKIKDDADKCLKPGSMQCNLLGAPPCCSGSMCNKMGMCERKSDDDDDDDAKPSCSKPGTMHCNLLGAPRCCRGSKCNKVGKSDSDMFMCEKTSDDDGDDDDKDGDMCLKPGSLHCNHMGAKCCPGSKCNKVGRSDSNTFMCERESDDDDAKECLVVGAYHCNIPGLKCCPGASCKNVRGESFMCAKDSNDNDDDFPYENQKPLISLKEKSSFEEDCNKNMCIEGGQMCHRHRQNSKCPPAPCCPGFGCAYVDAHQESFCVSMPNQPEKTQATSSPEKHAMSKKKNGLMAENCALQSPEGCSPHGCPCIKGLISDSCCVGQRCTGMSESGTPYCMTPEYQEGKHSTLYALKGMFRGFVEKIGREHCLPHGEACMMHHDKCCHGLMCHSGQCMTTDKEDLKL